MSDEKGLVIVNTGNGKGKTTAALGQTLRAAGHGIKVCFVQFVKGKWKTGEAEALRRFANDVELHVTGTGFTWLETDLDKVKQAAQLGWDLARRKMMSSRYGLIVLDEFTYVLEYGLIPMEDVQAALAGRPSGVTVVVTGRNAPAWLVESADIVTEMKAVKHDYEKGRRAWRGIEY
jgi:cob(I)alamin adenosyltransferase